MPGPMSVNLFIDRMKGSPGLYYLEILNTRCAQTRKLRRLGSNIDLVPQFNRPGSSVTGIGVSYTIPGTLNSSFRNTVLVNLYVPLAK